MSIHDHAKAGDAKEIETLLESGIVDANHIPAGPDGALHGTALHVAASNGRMPAVKVLLKYGADVNIGRDEDQSS